MQSRHIKTSRVELHYLEAGSGEPLLLIHGWPQTSHCWHKVMPILARNFRVIAPDLRGFGTSEKSGLPLSRAQMAADMASLLDALQIDNTRVAGHDWGGMIALKLALDFPQRLSRLCLIDCSTTHWPTWAAHGLWAKIPGLAENFFARSSEAFLRWCFNNETAHYPDDVVSPFPTKPLPGQSWCDAASLQHYIDNMAQTGTQAACVSLYRDALPFHQQDSEGCWQIMTVDTCRDIWQYPEGPFRHPAYRHAICFAPEDLGKQIAIPSLFVYTPMLLPGGFQDGIAIPDYHPAGNAYADSIAAPFTDLRCTGINSGHFIPEEQPAALTAAMADFFR